MAVPSERTPTGGLGRLLAAAIGFSLVAPAALIALPLAALLVVSHPRTSTASLALGVAAAIALWWLVLPGELPDQAVRAATVIATAVFVTLSERTQLTVTHRVLAAVGAAGAGVTALLGVLGSSWGAVEWSVGRRYGLATRSLIGQLWTASGQLSGEESRLPQALADFDAWLGSLVEVAARYFPAITAFELMAGLALATALAHRVAHRPVGRPLGRLREFRFSEHLGWAAVVPLVVLLLPMLAAAKTAAANVLAVAAGLYALRGVAVAAFGLATAGIGGAGLAVGAALLTLILLPVAAAGAILMGLLDAGLDLRRRWSTPPTSE